MTHWLVVGGGTAGCVLASRLSADPRHHVTLVEAGPARAGSPSASYLDDLAAAAAVWPGLTVSDGDDARRAYPQGRGLGGSSAVNGAVLSGDGVNDERSDLIPRDHVASAELGPIDRALVAATPDAGRATLSRRSGLRVSTADTYLSAVCSRNNLEVITDMLVERVLLEGRRATGVISGHGDRLVADHVVIAAGAIHSPALLLRSGIDVVGVGVGLQDHPSRTIEIALRAGDAIAADPHTLVTGAVLRNGVFEIVTMNHLGPRRPMTAGLLVGLLRSRRRGSVRLDPARPDDPTAPPLVDFGRLDDPQDVSALESGVADAETLLGMPPFTEIVDSWTVLDGFGAYAHASSSCAMGTVVDEDAAVVGYVGLFVADASVFPEIPASGTYLPVVRLAELLARRWLTW